MGQHQRASSAGIITSSTINAARQKGNKEMKTYQMILLLTVAILLLTTGLGDRRAERRACRQAFRQCKFKFVGARGILSFSLPNHWDQSFTPPIESKTPSQNIGIVNTNNMNPEAILEDGPHALPALEGLADVSLTALKPFPIPGTRRCGVGQQFLRVKQRRALAGRCYRVFFSNYELLNSANMVIDHVSDSRKDHFACVVFRIVQ